MPTTRAYKRRVCLDDHSMLLFALKLLGRICAATPELLLHALAATLGRLIYLGYVSRRRLMLTNIRTSFPERSEAWCAKVARASCQRLVETSLLSLATPYLSERRIQNMAALSPLWTKFASEHALNPKGILLGTAHLAYWEGLTWVPFLLKGQAPEFVAVYRPLRQPALDEWTRRTRERFGVRLLSRRVGLHAALHLLKRNGGVSILFDQNAGSNGVLTHFFGRECSTTPLPGMLVQKSGANVAIIYTRRTAFWRFTIEIERVRHAGTSESVTIGLNRALEDILRADEDLCASWLWLHNRWKILQLPEDLARLRSKRGDLTHLDVQDAPSGD